MRKTTMVLGNIKLPPSLNFTFNVEDQQKVPGNIKLPLPLNLKFLWENNKGIRE